MEKLSSDSENDNENASIVTQDFQNPQSLLDFESPAMQTTWADEANMGTYGECNKRHDLTEPCPIGVDEQKLIADIIKRNIKKANVPMKSKAKFMI